MKRGGIFALQISPAFTRYGLSGADGLGVLETIKRAFWENKQEETNGGLMGALTELYGQGEPPPLAIDTVISEILFYANTRGGIVQVLDEVIAMVKSDGKTDLTQPWRLCLIQIFQVANKSVEAEKSAMTELKSTLSSVEESAAAEDDD